MIFFKYGIRSMWEGNVFTGMCLFTGGLPLESQALGLPLEGQGLALNGGGLHFPEPLIAYSHCTRKRLVSVQGTEMDYGPCPCLGPV